MDDYNGKQREAIGLLGMDEAKRMGLLEPGRLSAQSLNCPKCGYPDTYDGNHYKGIYVTGRPCGHCGYTHTGGLDIVNQAGEDVEVAVEELTRKEVLEGLHAMRDQCRPPSFFSTQLSRAIAYLETDPAEALAEDYAARMVDRAFAIESHAELQHTLGKAAGLREAARMLRDKDSR